MAPRCASPGHTGLKGHFKVFHHRYSPHLKDSTILGMFCPGDPVEQGKASHSSQCLTLVLGFILAPGLSFSGNRGSEPPHPSQSWSTGLAASVLPSVTTGTSPSGLDTKFGERKRKFWSPRHPLVFPIKGQAHRSCHSESAFCWQPESPPGKSLSCVILLCR